MLTDEKTKRARSSNSFVSVIISWLGIAEGFQTFDSIQAVKIEEDIREIRTLLDDEETLQC